MANNYVPATDAGATYHATESAGVKYPGTVNLLDNGGSPVVVSAANPLPVSLASVPSHAVTNAGTFATQATLAAETTKVIGTVNVAASQIIAVTDNSGSLTVDAPVATPVFVRLSDGSAAITTLAVSLASVPSHAVTNAGTFAVQQAASAVGGFTPGRVVAAASTNTGFIKASAGTLGYSLIINLTATPKFLKLYNKTSAPTLAADTPVWTIPVPANSTTGAGIAFGIPPQGINFSTGIAYAITGAIADTDTTALAANDLVWNYAYT